MSNASAQHELVGVLINTYPCLTLRLAEVTSYPCPPHEQVLAGPNTHQQVRNVGREPGPPKAGEADEANPGIKARKRGQISTDATVHLLTRGEKRHFFQVEMQRDYGFPKLATLRAYHGSEVRNARCGGHVFVLSPKPTVTASYRRAEEEAAARLVFSVTYLSSLDLAPLAGKDRPFEERALAAAVTDFSRGMPDTTVAMLHEMREHDDTIADLFFTAIVEECPDDSELEEKMSEVAMRRLEGLPSFQRWAADKIERITQQVQETLEAEARTREAKREQELRAEQAKHEEELRAEYEAKAKKERVEAETTLAREVIQALRTYFTAKGDVPTPSAVKTMDGCTNPETARYWLGRAYAGETSAKIFPEDGETRLRFEVRPVPDAGTRQSRIHED